MKPTHWFIVLAAVALAFVLAAPHFRPQEPQERPAIDTPEARMVAKYLVAVGFPQTRVHLVGPSGREYVIGAVFTYTDGKKRRVPCWAEFRIYEGAISGHQVHYPPGYSQGVP